MDDQDAINQQEWERDENWSALGIYRSARDSRVWVPKRNPAFGVTVNLAHRAGWFPLLGLSIVPVALILFVVLLRSFR